MAALRKASVAAPTPPKEAVLVESLGGEVIVRGLLLRDRLELATSTDKFASVSALLAATVVDADGVQFWTADEWEVFGARHFDEALRLFAVAQRLAGLDREAAEKN